MNVIDKEYFNKLKEIIDTAENGDEDGMKPDLTDSEIQALKWAVRYIEVKE